MSTQGVPLNETHAATEEECLADCKVEPGCQWYTWSSVTSGCDLMDNCDDFDSTACPGCVVGQKECETPPDPSA